MNSGDSLVPVLLIIGAGWFFWGQAEDDSHTGDKNVEQSSIHEPASDSREPAEAEPTRLVPPVPDCLRDDSGLLQRVQVISAGVRCAAQPGGPATGAPLQYFRPYFVFEVKSEGQTVQHYRIGPEPHRAQIQGWVAAKHVKSWPTNAAGRLAGGAGVTMVVYAEPEPQETLLRGGIPTAQPIARATAQPGRRYMPWPITEVRRVEINGHVHEIARIRFLAETPGSAGAENPLSQAESYSDETIAQVKENIGKVDIVFCVDNSESTKVYSDTIREAIGSIARQLQGQDIHLGLVLYRDYRQELMFSEGVVHHAFRLSHDVPGFLRTLDTVREANGDPGNWPEAGYDGLLASIENTDWRGDQLTQRIVVMVSDNSYQLPGSSRNPNDIGLPQIAAAAAQRNVKVFGLCIHGAGGDQEQTRHRRQIDEITRVTGGKVYPLAQATRQSSVSELSEHIATVLSVVESPGQQAKVRRQVVTALRDGCSTQEIAQRHRLPIHDVTDVLELLEGAGYDLRKLAANGPVPAEGWVLCEFQGVTLLEREAYVSEGELDALLATINQLAAYCKQKDFAEQVLWGGIAARTNPLVDFMSHDYPGTLDAYLMARGIPAGQTSLLRKTPSEIRSMNESEREALRHRLINESHQGLSKIRSERDYWQLAGSQRYAWIPERLLP